MKKALQLAAALVLAVMIPITLHKVLYLSDHVDKLVNPVMTVTKSSTWWCPSELRWVTVTVSGENREAVCKEFKEAVEEEEEDCPPGEPPGSPPAMALGGGAPASSREAEPPEESQGH